MNNQYWLVTAVRQGPQSCSFSMATFVIDKHPVIWLAVDGTYTSENKVHQLAIVQALPITEGQYALMVRDGFTASNARTSMGL